MRACVPYDPWAMRILEDSRHTSASDVSLDCTEPARVRAKVVIGGGANGERRRAKWSLVRGFRKLTLVSGITAASGAAIRTYFRSFFSVSLSFGERFCASIDGAGTSMIDPLGMWGFMRMELAGSAWEARHTTAGSPVRSVLGTTVDSEAAICTGFFSIISRSLSTRGGFCAFLGSGRVSPRVRTARGSVAFKVEEFGLGCSATTVLTVGRFHSLQTGIGLHLAG